MKYASEKCVGISIGSGEEVVGYLVRRMREGEREAFICPMVDDVIRVDGKYILGPFIPVLPDAIAPVEDENLKDADMHFTGSSVLTGEVVSGYLVRCEGTKYEGCAFICQDVTMCGEMECDFPSPLYWSIGMFTHVNASEVMHDDPVSIQEADRKLLEAYKATGMTPGAILRMMEYFEKVKSEQEALSNGLKELAAITIRNNAGQREMSVKAFELATENKELKQENAHLKWRLSVIANMAQKEA